MKTDRNSHFSLRARLRSFGYAGNGLRLLIAGEHNARIHCGAAAAAIVLGLWLGLSRGEWLAVVIVIGAVFTAEAFNSALETLCDLVSSGYHPLIKRTKDLAAAAVLLTALAAAAVGAMVFVPKIISHFG